MPDGGSGVERNIVTVYIQSGTKTTNDAQNKTYDQICTAPTYADVMSISKYIVFPASYGSQQDLI